MKKIILSAIFLTILFNSMTASAQSALIASNATNTSFAYGGVTNETLSSTELSSAAVEGKVLHSFTKHFKNSDNVKWYDDKGYFMASFRLEDRPALVWFNKSGKIINSVYYGSEKHLPHAEKDLIRTTYEDYEIGATQEVTADNAKAWVATLQNCSRILKVRIMNGEIEELQTIKKSK